MSDSSSARSPESCRVVIVDEHQAVRELLRDVLTRAEPKSYAVLELGASKQEALDLCSRLRPDVVVLEMILPDGSGIEVLDRLRREQPGTRVVFFTGCEQITLVMQAIGMGVNGYVLKTRPLQTLLAAIDQVCGGGQYVDPALLIERRKHGASSPGNPLQLLTTREREVTRLIAQGKTTKEAAAELGVSAKTLDKHRSNLMRKLGVHDAVGVTHYAISAGLIAVG